MTNPTAADAARTDAEERLERQRRHEAAKALDERVAEATQAVWRARQDVATAEQRLERATRRRMRRAKYTNATGYGGEKYQRAVKREQTAAARLQRRQERLEAAERALAAVDPIQRAQKAVSGIYDKLNTIGAFDTEATDTATAPAERPGFKSDHVIVDEPYLSLDLDADTRPAHVQADEFFTREGDFHQVQITIPTAPNDPIHTERPIIATAVIKFTPEQQPLAVEILRQLRGALGARITITKLEQRAPEPIEELDIERIRTIRAEIHRAIDACDLCNRDGHQGDGLPCDHGAPAFVLTDEAVTVKRPGPILPPDDQAEADRQREAYAAILGVPADRLAPVPSPTGETAYTITPPPADTSGRHAKPDETAPPKTFDIAELRAARYEHSMLNTTTTFGPLGDPETITHRCSCGEELTAGPGVIGDLWKRHRDEAATSITVRTWLPGDPVTDAEKQWRDIETKWHESNGPVVLQHGTAQPFIADQIHDATYGDTDD